MATEIQGDNVQLKFTDEQNDQLLVMPVGDGLIVGTRAAIILDEDDGRVYVAVELTPEDLDALRAFLAAARREG